MMTYAIAPPYPSTAFMQRVNEAAVKARAVEAVYHYKEDITLMFFKTRRSIYLPKPIRRISHLELLSLRFFPTVEYYETAHPQYWYAGN